VFVDDLEIRVRAGDGGPGCLSFRREKFVPRGGPDGGDGGDGGDVVIHAVAGETSLHPLKGQAEFRAQKGGAGGPQNRTGRRGEDLTLSVPVGTMVHDAARDNLLADLDHDGASVVVAAGGRRGRGNKSFATATNRAPRQCEPGMPGEARTVRLVLKLIADVGLIGLPNAGKSTLLSCLSRARPKVAAYPFTTLTPHLGIVEIPGYRSFVMADIPGLIEGAHGGKGLGHQFLRHVERTRVLLHLVDCQSEEDPVESWRVIREELESYSKTLAERPCLVVGTKVEDEASRARCERLGAELGRPVLAISSATRQGLDDLIRALLPLLWPADD